MFWLWYLEAHNHLMAAEPYKYFSISEWTPHVWAWKEISNKYGEN